MTVTTAPATPPERAERPSDASTPASGPSLPKPARQHASTASSGTQHRPSGDRSDRIDRLAARTVTATLAAPLLLLALALLVALIIGPFDEDEPSVVVNDQTSCTGSPLTLTPEELATRLYWEECTP